MNEVRLIGYLGKDVKLTYSKDGQTAISKFDVACSRPYAKGKSGGVDFVPCVAFGKTAETIEKFFKKGSNIVVSGSWQISTYKNNEGHTIKTHQCVVERFEFVGKKSESGYTDTPSIPQGTDSDDFFLNVDSDGELPFS